MLYVELEKIVELSFCGVKMMVVKFEQNKDVVYFFYQLVIIKIDVELEFICEELEVQLLVVDDLLVLFRQYEFKCWIIDVEVGKWLQVKGGKLVVKFVVFVVVVEVEEEVEVVIVFLVEYYVIIFDEVMLFIWIDKLKQVLFFVFDMEIDSLDNIFVNMVGFLFVVESGVVVYVLVVYDYFDVLDQILCECVLVLFKLLLEDEKVFKVG